MNKLIVTWIFSLFFSTSPTFAAFQIKPYEMVNKFQEVIDERLQGERACQWPRNEELCSQKRDLVSFQVYDENLNSLYQIIRSDHLGDEEKLKFRDIQRKWIQSKAPFEDNPASHFDLTKGRIILFAELFNAYERKASNAEKTSIWKRLESANVPVDQLKEPETLEEFYFLLQSKHDRRPFQTRGLVYFDRNELDAKYPSKTRLGLGRVVNDRRISDVISRLGIYHGEAHFDGGSSSIFGSQAYEGTEERPDVFQWSDWERQVSIYGIFYASLDDIIKQEGILLVSPDFNSQEELPEEFWTDLKAWQDRDGQSWTKDLEINFWRPEVEFDKQLSVFVQEKSQGIRDAAINSFWEEKIIEKANGYEFKTTVTERVEYQFDTELSGNLCSLDDRIRDIMEMRVRLTAFLSPVRERSQKAEEIRKTFSENRSLERAKNLAEEYSFVFDNNYDLENGEARRAEIYYTLKLLLEALENLKSLGEWEDKLELDNLAAFTSMSDYYSIGLPKPKNPCFGEELVTHHLGFWAHSFWRRRAMEGLDKFAEKLAKTLVSAYEENPESKSLDKSSLFGGVEIVDISMSSEQNGWAVQEEPFLAAKQNGEVTFGDTLILRFVERKNCNEVNILIPVYTMKKNTKIGDLGGSPVEVSINGKPRNGEILFVSEFLSGHRLMLDLGWSNLSQLSAYFSSTSAAEISIERSNGEDMSEYLDIKTNRWSLVGMNGALRKAREICDSRSF